MLQQISQQLFPSVPYVPISIYHIYLRNSSNINMFPEVLATIASVVGGAGAGAALGTVPLSAAMPSCEVFQCYVICYGQDMARLLGGDEKRSNDDQ